MHYTRKVTKRGTVRIFGSEWHDERNGVPGALKDKIGALVFVYVEQPGMVPVALNTTDSPHAYGNLICRLEIAH